MRAVESVEGVEEGVSGSVGSSAASVGLTALAVFLRLAAKGTLVTISRRLATRRNTMEPT